jgi:predicted membrane-bound spermidine synthase
MEMLTRFVLIGAVSLTTLALELFFTKILSFVFWNHVVYLIISIALLGYGASSTFVLLARKRIASVGEEVFTGANVLLLVFSALGALLLIAGTTYQFSTTHPLRSVESLLATYFALTLPFFFAGNVIVFLFASHPERANALYGWDLAGAALGCLLFPILMPWLGAPGSVTLLLLLVCLASLLFLARGRGGGRGRALLTGTALTCLLLAVAIPFVDGWLAFKPDLTKSLGFALNKLINPAVVHEYHRWDVVTRLDVVSSEQPYDIGWIKIPAGRKLVNFDGDAGSEMPHLTAEFPTPEDARRFSQADFRAPFFKEVTDGNHLIVGLGGGPDVAQSLAMGASKITAVDINAAILDAMTRVYQDHSGNIFNRPTVRLVHAEGRSFLRASPETFDLIRMTGVDTFAAHTIGAYVLAENYLYTVEAFREYFRRLKDNGVLCLQRWFEESSPRESLRLFAVILAALRQEGMEHPEEHVIVLWRRSPSHQPPGVTFVRKRPYTPEEIRTLDQRLTVIVAAGADEVTPIYYPHTPPFALAASREFHAYAEAFTGGVSAAFEDRYPYDITPSIDDRPFFFNYFKAANMFREWNRTGPIQGYWAYFVFGLILCCASMAVAIFIWLPLLVFRREGLRTRGSGLLALYFCCLGLGFIMIEITAMQKFALLLGHPMYAIATVMGGMLVFAGLGSHLSGRFVAAPVRALSTCSVAIVVFCLFLASPYATRLIDSLLAAGIAVRILATLAVLSVGAIPLGFFFPIGLRLAGRTDDRFIPWAWGINSGFTVIGSVCTVAAAMRIGFSALLALAAAIYLVALLSIRMHQRTWHHPHANRVS